ncbi:hypothetical protein PM082_016598 [Marasmius tenuissimus]|nr:hypothetical protein PM082_016598 [Marasmius tenuissimus]
MDPGGAQDNSASTSSVAGNRFHNTYRGSHVSVHQIIHSPVNNPQAHINFSGPPLSEAHFNPSELPEKERYVRLMSYLGRGSALWYPSAGTEGQSGGIRIGDVGIMRPDRPFDCLFNIRREYAADAINKSLPPDFIYYDSSPLDLEEGAYEQDPHVCVNLKRSPQSNRPGAILVLPHRSRQETLRNTRGFLQFAWKHSLNWFTHAEEVQERLLTDDDLFLVTGVEKSRSWGICSFQSEQMNSPVELCFKGRTSGEGEGDRMTYSWDYTNGAKSHSYPNHNDVQVETGVEDQTVFIRGFVMTRWPVSVYTPGPTRRHILEEKLRIYFDVGDVYHQFPESETYQDDTEDPRLLVTSESDKTRVSSPVVSPPYESWFTGPDIFSPRSTLSESLPDSSQDATSSASDESLENLDERLRWAVFYYGPEPDAVQRAKICKAARCSGEQLTQWLKSREEMSGQHINDEDSIPTPIMGDNATTHMNVHERRVTSVNETPVGVRQVWWHNFKARASIWVQGRTWHPRALGLTIIPVILISLALRLRRIAPKAPTPS